MIVITFRPELVAHHVKIIFVLPVWDIWVTVFVGLDAQIVWEKIQRVHLIAQTHACVQFVPTVNLVYRATCVVPKDALLAENLTLPITANELKPNGKLHIS